MAVDERIFETTAAVPYRAARQQIRNGDILLGHGRAMFSQLIQAATKSAWSHVAFIWRIEDIDRIIVLESVENHGVRAVSLNTKINGGSAGKPYNGKLVVARHRDFANLVSSDAMNRMTEHAIDRLGCPYDPGEVAGIAWRIMAGMLKIRLRPSTHRNNAYICSEYAAECYAAIGITIPWDQQGFIAPADFAADPKIEPVVVLDRDLPA